MSERSYEVSPSVSRSKLSFDDSFLVSPTKRREEISRKIKRSRIYDDPVVTEAYAAVPLLDAQPLPRGGISIETAAVGRIQFGIPPETIKDSMRLGLEVPLVYIVPTEQFCRDMGPALGINLAEFEFPAYFNFFIRKKKCILVVDNQETETNILDVFEETLLGPYEFRDDEQPLAYSERDFDPSFPQEKRPNMYNELRHFRIFDKSKPETELKTRSLLDFRHLKQREENDEIGSPPLPQGVEADLVRLHASHSSLGSEGGVSRVLGASQGSLTPMSGILELEEGEFERDEKKTRSRSRDSNGSFSTLDSFPDLSLTSGHLSGKKESNWSYSKVKWLSTMTTIWPSDATSEQIEKRSVPRVEIFKMLSGTEYVIHDVDENNHIIGKVRFSSRVHIPQSIEVEGFCQGSFGGKEKLPRPFIPPSFGITILGNSHGFDKNGSTSGYVLWINGRGVMVDPPPYSSATLEKEGIRPQMIIGVIITHCHADHDAGAFQKLLTGSRGVIITSPSIYESFLRKYAALSKMRPNLLRQSHRFRPAVIGRPLHFQGATFHFTYSLHAIPCIGFKVVWRDKSIVFTGDHFFVPSALDDLAREGVLSKGRAEDLKHLSLQECDVLLHEAGAPPIHTPLTELEKLPQKVKERLYVVHTAALPNDTTLKVAPTGVHATIRLSEQAEDSGRRKVGLPGDLPLSLFQPTPIAGKGRAKGDNMLTLNRSDTDSRLPTDVSDTWFILNLLSNIPFFNTLSFANTLEVLESVYVQSFLPGEQVLAVDERGSVLFIVWEGSCIEDIDHQVRGMTDSDEELSVWFAGEWSGPRGLQPDITKCSGQDDMDCPRIVAGAGSVSKVIMIHLADINKILTRGSRTFRRFQRTHVHSLNSKGSDSNFRSMEGSGNNSVTDLSASGYDQFDATDPGSVLYAMHCNSVLSSLSALQKQALETISEGPKYFEPAQYLWKAGDHCDCGYLLVSGGAAFVRHVDAVVLPGTSQAVVEIEDGLELELYREIQDFNVESEYGRVVALLTSMAEKAESDQMPSLITRNGASDTKKAISRGRFCNQVLSRLYSNRRFLKNVEFCKGAFFADTTRMVSGELTSDAFEAGVFESTFHTSTLRAGKRGCTVYVFPRTALINFLDAHPGLLLGLMGTNVVI